MLPVGSDHVIPARWVTDIHRDWGQRYVWPRFTTAVPREFFDAVRAEATPAARRARWITPQTRDMNPVYTGKDVSYIDTKQAQRAIETAVAEAERFATLAWLAGAPYPHAALDKAWRLLAYGAHHDGITGVESDQVYLDLLGGWREAWELASARAATRWPAVRPALAGHGGAARRRAASRSGCSTGWPGLGSQLATVTVSWPADGTRWAGVRDEAGRPVPALAEGIQRREDGSLAELTLTFPARDVPALGWRTYQVVPAAEGDPAAAGPWREVTGGPPAIENGRYLVTADPARGGTVSVTDRRTGVSLLAGPGNELVIQDEYAQHPRHGEGPWHLSPKGPGTGSASGPAAVRVQQCPVGRRLVASFSLDELEVTQETVLWEDADRVEFRTHVDGYRGHDRLLRVRFPADVPGGLPVFQTATAVIGRTFGAVDVDSEDTWYTLDSPAYEWFGLGRCGPGPDRRRPAARSRPSGWPRSSARTAVRARAAGGDPRPDGGAGRGRGDRDLQPGRRAAVRRAGRGLQPARRQDRGRRAGREQLHRRGAGGRGPRLRQGAGRPRGRRRVWVPAARSRADAFAPNADVRGVADLPVLVVAAGGPDKLAAALARPGRGPGRRRGGGRVEDAGGRRRAAAAGAAGRPVGGAAEPGHAGRRRHPRRHAAHVADALVQRVAVPDLDRR